MKGRLFWPKAYGFFLVLPPFQHRRLDRMGFGELLSIEPFWLDLALIQELQRRWDSHSGAFLFSWGHMTSTLKDMNRLTGLRVYGATLSGHSLTDYRHLVESYLGFSPSGEGALRGVDRSEFFSTIGLSGLRRGPEESIAAFVLELPRG